MERIKNTAVIFAKVTTLVVFATAIFITIFEGKDVTLGVELLWQILATSFLTSLGTLCYPTTEMSKKRFVIIVFFHYCYVNVVVLGSGIFYKWFELEEIASIIGMLILIFVVFLLVMFFSLVKDIPIAKVLNEKLKERNKEEE